MHLQIQSHPRPKRTRKLQTRKHRLGTGYSLETDAIPRTSWWDNNSSRRRLIQETSFREVHVQDPLAWMEGKGKPAFSPPRIGGLHNPPHSPLDNILGPSRFWSRKQMFRDPGLQHNPLGPRTNPTLRNFPLRSLPSSRLSRSPTRPR